LEVELLKYTDFSILNDRTVDDLILASLVRENDVPFSTTKSFTDEDIDKFNRPNLKLNARYTLDVNEIKQVSVE